MSPHISWSETAVRPRRGIIGRASGVEEDLFREVDGVLTLVEVFSDLTLEREVLGEGLDLGVE